MESETKEAREESEKGQVTDAIEMPSAALSLRRPQLQTISFYFVKL